MDQSIINQIKIETGFTFNQIKTVGNFLDEGATIPFLARYRQEATGGLDEEQLRAIRDKIEYHKTVEDRKLTILKAIKEQDKLTDDLKKEILDCTDLQKLEDIYLPFKKKRKTKGDKAKDKNLEPLAKCIWEQDIEDQPIEQVVQSFIKENNKVSGFEDALEGARHIISEWINESRDVRDMLRKKFQQHAKIEAEKTPNVEGRTPFEDYYDFARNINHLKPHQVLALNRAEQEEVLYVRVEVWDERMMDDIDDLIITNEYSIFVEQIQLASEDAYKRLLFPSLARELRSNLTESAEEHAIETFAENVSNLLMQPPLKNKIVMGIDPAYRTGCKIAVVDEMGKYLEGTTIYPTPPQKKIEESATTLKQLINKHGVELIAIGNGTASRETEQFVAELIQNNTALNDLSYLIVNEAGASVYSASKEARDEFPHLDAPQRGNISIARRVQDPLAELVKIDPKSIGVGLYQHDLNQTKLSKKLDDVVESSVNKVGVNLNTASSALLQYVSGLSSRTAKNIVAHRENKGAFKDRQALRKITGIGDFRFQQSAGFLRIPGANNPLDNTAIHPESYDVTQKLCDYFEINIKHLNQQRSSIAKKLEGRSIASVAKDLGTGEPTLDLIIENLLKPGRDPREDLPKPLLRTDVLKMEDLQTGQKLEGTVRNVVDFGAFVDIGVKQDGLLHISELGTENRRIENIYDHISVGNIVKVEIKSVDLERGRISLAKVDPVN